MKQPIFLLLESCLFFCCNDKKDNNEPAADQPGEKDTVAVPRPDKTINSYAPVDLSPMDMSYYPADYPKLKMAKSITTPPLARVVYSRPHLQGRELFHDVLKYGEPWRLGANEATELELYADATIQDKLIKAGRYILYCIPAKESWTIVLNNNLDTWGLQPDATGDIAKFSVPVKQTTNALEFFTMVFLQTKKGADLVMAWDNVEARLPISF
jgi:hypothetical protein